MQKSIDLYKKHAGEKEKKRMRKFVVFSGFLGSGKTTTMIALTKYFTEHYAKAAMISNDLGKDVTLADHHLARLSGCNASEITAECICFCHDVLTDRLNAYYDDGCELVVSDIPGFGVGALEHVYHGINNNEKYRGKYELGPFTVLTEPRNVELLKTGVKGDMTHILHAQLMEADLIVLNKCDLLDSSGVDAEKAWLSEHYPEAEVTAVSAQTGEGLDELSRALTQGRASMRHPDIDYEDEELQREMGSLTEYYIQYHAVVCCGYFDGTAYLAGMAGRVQEELRSAAEEQEGLCSVGMEIPHMKLLAWSPEGSFGKVDLLGISRPAEITHPFKQPCTSLAVIINANAACPAAILDEIITRTVEEVSLTYQLELVIHKKECFNLGD